MSDTILIKINVSKIDKRRLFKGKKGTYLDAVLIPTPNSQYQDYMLKQSVTKEERDRGIEGEIIGGGNRLHSGNRTGGSNRDYNTPSGADPNNIPPDDDVPF